MGTGLSSQVSEVFHTHTHNTHLHVRIQYFSQGKLPLIKPATVTLVSIRVNVT